MICPVLDSIYEYLDGGLSAAERAAFEAHLAVCPGCRAALAERRAIAEAATTLPAIEVPADFAESIMSRLPAGPAEEALAARARVPRLAAVLTGASALGAVAIAVSMITGNGLFGIFLGFGRILQTTAVSSSQAILKAAKIAVHLGRMAVEFLSRLVEGFRIAASFIGPEGQIIVVATVVAATLAAGILFGRKLNMEKKHDEI
jgi:anti-sigma factor RsiW